MLPLGEFLKDSLEDIKHLLEEHGVMFLS